MKRLTPEAFDRADNLGCVVDDYQIGKLLMEIDTLGGPVCVNCEKNQARYTSGCCGLCDMLLPAKERGVLRSSCIADRAPREIEDDDESDFCAALMASTRVRL